VHEREDLFAGWRLFFERMAEVNPVVLVFDDMHWANPSLLDFVEYLLEWSRNFPIFILTLARPDPVERHPQWGRRQAELHLALPRAAPGGRDGGADRGLRPGAAR
jgi:hypothetical protein